MKKYIFAITVLLVLSACSANLSQAEIDATVNAKVSATLNAVPATAQPAAPSATVALLPTPIPTQLSLPPAASTTSVPPTGSAIELVELASPVTSGTNAAITIRTLPNAICSIAVTSATAGSGSGSGAGNNPSLVTKTADNDGVVSWIWTLGAKAPVGTRQITIDCTPGGHAEYSFEVQ